MITVTCPNCDCVIHVDESSKPKTNSDSIRAMSDEDLADMFSSISCCHEKGRDCMKYSDGMGGRNCYQCWLDWLKQEAEL